MVFRSGCLVGDLGHRRWIRGEPDEFLFKASSDHPTNVCGRLRSLEVKLDTIKVILTVISGVCWTVVYIEGIRIGFRDKSYAIPFYALALNFAWELLHTIYGFRAGVSVQTIINAVWFAFDCGILFTYFRYGRKYFPRSLTPRAFIGWSVLGLVTALCVEYGFIREFGVAVGAGYSAFLQNLLMSVLFIGMFVR